jgi:hypothetical protein
MSPKKKNDNVTAVTESSGEIEEAISALSLSIWEIEEGGSELMELRQEVILAQPTEASASSNESIEPEKETSQKSTEK